MDKKTSIIYKTEVPESYGNLKLFCDVYGLSYNTFSRKKFPFLLDGYEVHKVEHLSGGIDDSMRKKRRIDKRKDYDKLYDRICDDEHVAVLVDCDWRDGKVTRDIAYIKRYDNADINIGVRGIEYGSVRKWKLEDKTEKQAFIDECKRLKLEII
jgi:hypothetical protein